MSDFDTVMEESGLPALFGMFGDSATVSRASTEISAPTVIVTKDFQLGPSLIDTYGNVHAQRRTTIEFWLSEIAAAGYTPAPGDVVTVGADSYTLDEKQADDGYMSRWVVY